METSDLYTCDIAKPHHAGGTAIFKTGPFIVYCEIPSHARKMPSANADAVVTQS